nr:exosortase/archaeosortase family protein [uncultured Desulfobulbus sp.]
MRERRAVLLGLVVCFLFGLAYWPVFEILFAKWSDSEEYSHAFLTLPIIFYIAFQANDKFSDSEPKFCWLGGILLGISSLSYFFSLLTEVHTVIALSMYLTVVGVLIFLFGIQSLRILFTPLLLLLMLIPFPDQLYIQLTFPLQLKVSQMSAAIVEWVGIPVYRAGNVLSIPEKSFEVIEACSGLRSVITLLTLSVIMGFFVLRQVWTKVVLVAISVPVAIFVNLIRVVAIILLFHFFGLDLYTGTLHTLTGLAIFSIALAVLFLVGRILEFWEIKKS